MGFILRTAQDTNNPNLAGGVYWYYITIGKAIYYKYSGSQTSGIIFISDGGKYGLDSVSSVEYKGSPLTVTTNWIFHRGTFTKQIAPIAVTVNAGTDTFTNTGTNPFTNGDQVRGRAIDGNLPVPLSIVEGLGQSPKYFIINRTATTFQLSLTSGGSAIDITDVGSGTLIFWKADTGFDDPDQGLPTFCPEVGSTFNNIAYIEFKLPSGSSSPTDPPDWEDFRIFGIGRRLMDYDATGAEVGVTSDDDLLGNPALILADNYLYSYKGKPERIDWTSWYAMRQASNAEILQRVNTTDTATVNGLTARYFGNDDFTNQIISRLDANINIVDTLPTTNPASGVSGYGFSVIWKGQIKPRYSELYTLTLDIDDEAELYINGGLLMNPTTVGAHTATYSFVADELYTLEIRFSQTYLVALGNHYKCIFKWQSASQSLEVVPTTRLFPSDEIVKRYRVSLAFNSPTEASEVHERIMERIVGWDWTDDNGLIKFLPPDREPVFEFKFDRIDDDSKANFVGKTFEKKRRGLADRENFKLGRFRNVLLDLYPFQFVQADREELRLFTNGEPSNSAYIDIGVMTESQAQRFLEHELVLKTDPDHTAQISGALSSSVLRKNQFVMVSYYDEDGNYVADQRYMIVFHGWGESNSKNDFSLLPIPADFYSDEAIEV